MINYKPEIKVKHIFLTLLSVILLASCSGNNDKSDAYGNFEATEVVISSEVNGTLLSFKIDEGQTLQPGEVIGIVDTTQLILKKKQLEAQGQSIKSKVSNVFSQIAVLEEQKDNALRDKRRIEFLLKDNAATPKEMDDINSRIAVIDKQVESIKTQNSTIVNEVKAIDYQVGQIRDMIYKSTIRNQVKGTVLNKFAEQYELVTAGKPLYKIADLSTMTLRVYVTGEQLPDIRIGQPVRVLVDKDKYSNRQLDGTISWISPKAEFTPKIIQTKQERTSLVYAVKVLVKNDGTLKIGMPGEVMLFERKKKS